MGALDLDLKLRDRIFGLDVMRAVAIGLVLLLNGDPLVRRNFPDFPRFWYIDGVDVFFVLSGFLIGRILINTFEKSGFSLQAIRRFWKFRWFRTLPNYYLILPITILFEYFKDGNIHDVDWRYFFFLQNLTGPIPPFFTISWSLVVEEWFYLTFPLVVYVLARMSSRLTVRSTVLLATFFFILFPFVLRVLKVYSIANPADVSDVFNFEMDFRAVAMFRPDSIAFGVLGAYVSHYHAETWFRYRFHSFAAGAVIYLLYRVYDEGLVKFTIGFTISSFALSLLLPLASSVRTGPSLIAVPVTHLSIVSYSAYLIHRTLVMDAFRALGGRPFSDLQAVVYYILYFVITILLSTLLYKYFEAPILRLREKPLFSRSNSDAGEVNPSAKERVPVLHERENVV